LKTAGPLFIGLDLGTSGARAVAIDEDGAERARGGCRLDIMGSDHRDPNIWWAAVETALGALGKNVDLARVVAIAVDGTSGTMLPVDSDGTPLARPLMYNDPVEDGAVIEKIVRIAPATSAAHGATSGLAKAITFQSIKGLSRVIHQADWIVGRLSGRYDFSDENNALKTGYDPVARCWPEWIGKTGMDLGLLPDVKPVGGPLATVAPEIARAFGLPNQAMIVAGTTDGCASFLATGADAIGDGVTALGTTLTLKLLSDTPIFAPAFGIYSHRIVDRWLAGGASNTGGNVLLAHFSVGDMAALESKLDPTKPTGLDYYPLTRPGERFPINDPALLPRLEPRPAEPSVFLQGLLEGIAAIEALGFTRLHNLGGPPLRSLRSVGGGARNPAWTQLRQMRLGVPFLAPISEEAAHGSALIARRGWHTWMKS
jgi:sugar (pentulose or hexulose) kinase